VLAPGFDWPADQAHGGLLGHLAHEAEHTLVNLGALLLGFALVAEYFERSGVPEHIPRLLPRSPLWGGFVLLAIVWVLSAFLDNIAAAMIGGVVARAAFRGRVTVAYIAAIVAASNAGGAWSVLGDTTTTMLWLHGVSPFAVADCAIASAVALVCVALPASARQSRVEPMRPRPSADRSPIDWPQLAIVAMVLVGAISANALFSGPWKGFFAGGPWYGVWAALVVGALFRRPAWGQIPGAARGAAFLLSLVWCASLMPVKDLPSASWQSTLALGFISSAFDNIPLTKLALEKGGYDWGVLAYAVGFGGSMVWFGSSAGVAISKDFPEARNVGRWVREGWFVAVAYVTGFFALLWILGWHPHESHVPEPATSAVPAAPVER
jgi:Na+/H+ antiporter NhaD/arsenite permease-like protein